MGSKAYIHTLTKVPNLNGGGGGGGGLPHSPLSMIVESYT